MLIPLTVTDHDGSKLSEFLKMYFKKLSVFSPTFRFFWLQLHQRNLSAFENYFENA